MRVLLVRVGKLLRLGVDLLDAGCDFGLLRGLQVLVSLLVGCLFLLRIGQVRLKCLLHLPENAEDLAALRCVGLLESGRCIEVVLRGLDERVGRPPLRVREHTLQQRGVPLHLLLERGRDTHHVAVGQLEQGFSMVLRQHRDGRLQRRDRFHQILLFRIEFRQLLLAERGGLIKGFLVFRLLLFEILDLSVEARAASSELLDLRRELRDARLGVRDRLRLLLVVGLAPACHLVVDRLILLGLLLELLHHVLEQCDHLGDRAVLQSCPSQGDR
mmetsp:Transcript_78270/g.175442  ORF Transcript_78270/g.175442 Transcript_78270/m.175442 type:complete len:272 (-) Transcript_78270:212-1027(-)